jgi:hypothetical protein
MQETLAQSRAYSTAAGAVAAPPHMPLRQESVSDITLNKSAQHDTASQSITDHDHVPSHDITRVTPPPKP